MPPKKNPSLEDNPTDSQRFADEQLVMVSEMYYQLGRSQSEIARMLQISQPQVSRMLEDARRRGIVRISIAEVDPRDHGLEESLQKSLGLKTALVIHTGKVEADLARKTVAHFTGPLVSRLVDSARSVAVAGGRTLLALSETMRPSGVEKDKPVVLQAMGCVGASPERWDSIEIGRKIAERWGTQFLMLNTPAFFPNAKVRNTMMELPQIRSVLDCLRDLDLALVGVGTLENSIFVERLAIEPSALSALSAAGAIGEICGHYYDIHGKECVHPLRDCVAGIELDWLRRSRDVMAVVVGADRAGAVVSAIRGGLVKSIVADSELAEAMLEYTETSGKRTKTNKRTSS